MPLILKRDKDAKPDNPDFYLVEDGTGREVGRIFRQVTARFTDPPSWFWGLSHPYERGSSKPHSGNAESREAAMAKFKARWLMTNK